MGLIDHMKETFAQSVSKGAEATRRERAWELFSTLIENEVQNKGWCSHERMVQFGATVKHADSEFADLEIPAED